MADDDKTYTQEDFDKAVEEERSKLVANRDKALDQAKAHKRELDELKRQHEELQETVRNLEQEAKAKAAGVPDEKLHEIREQIAADEARRWSNVADERDALKEQLAGAQGRIRELTLDNVVKGELGKAGAKADRIEALFKLTADRYELTDDGTVIAKDHRDVPLVKYLGTEVASEYPELFNGSGSSGGGASRSAGGAGGQTRFIAAGDKDAFMANLEGVASGEVGIRE
jgi:hypothetical protein